MLRRIATAMSDELDDRTYPWQLPIHKSAWRLLADSERSAARILGYTESLWNRGDAIGLFAQDWFELDPSYRRAAMALGYNRDLWLVEPRLGYKKRYWMLLRQDERRAARELGYEAATWEGGGETEACSRPWDALVADELSAALLLGYSSQSWGEEHEAVEEALGWVIVRVETQARHSGTADGTTSRLARDRRLLPSQAELQSHTLLLHPLL